MPMGDSAGRSAGNRTGVNALRRNTPRERAGIDPPWDRVVPRHRDEKDWVDYMMIAVGVLSVIFMSVLMTLCVSAWFGW